MTIRDDILAVMRATGKPLQSKEIARVLGVKTGTVASHLGQMRKERLVVKRTVAIGKEVQRGPFIFPESTAVVWFLPGSTSRSQLNAVRRNARVHKTLPRAVIPSEPVPHTGDMIQMLDDLRSPIQPFGE